MQSGRLQAQGVVSSARNNTGVHREPGFCCAAQSGPQSFSAGGVAAHG